MTSRDGFMWTPGEGGKPGIPSISVISPQHHTVGDNKEVLDVVVIGAGYSGLVAARDLVTQGTYQPFVRSRSTETCVQVNGCSFLRAGIASVDGRGIVPSMASTMRWAERGSIGRCRTYIVKCPCTRCRMIGSSARLQAGPWTSAR